MLFRSAVGTSAARVGAVKPIANSPAASASTPLICIMPLLKDADPSGRARGWQLIFFTKAAGYGGFQAVGVTGRRDPSCRSIAAVIAPESALIVKGLRSTSCPVKFSESPASPAYPVTNRMATSG